MTLKQLKQKLKKFLFLNKESKLKKVNKGFVIEKPWNDETFSLEIPNKPKDFINALNHLFLPPSLSAIYHTKTKNIEFIYTIFPVSEDIMTRSFEFRFRGVNYKCNFADSSPELLILGGNFKQNISPTSTYYRNLYQFKHYFEVISKPSLKDKYKYKPVSFWVNNVDMGEEGIIDLSSHLNFYMAYFDETSPLIAIHEKVIDGPTPQQNLKIKFPAVINSKNIQPYLLQLEKTASGAGSSFFSFLYNFQIIEYSAFYFLKSEESNKLNAVLLAPDLVTKIDQATDQILDIMANYQLTDENKFDYLFKTNIKPEILWEIIEPIKDKFMVKTEFEGGFCLEPLLKSGCTLDDFRMVYQNISQHLRSIRNVLVHSREKRSASSISPSLANARKLNPWLLIISRAAKEIIIYT